MKKVSLNYILDQLTELGWDYTCGRMSRSGMEIYDDIITVCFHFVVACLSNAFVCDVVLVKLYVFEKTHKRKNVCMFII